MTPSKLVARLLPEGPSWWQSSTAAGRTGIGELSVRVCQDLPEDLEAVSSNRELILGHERDTTFKNGTLLGCSTACDDGSEEYAAQRLPGQSWRSWSLRRQNNSSSSLALITKLRY